LKEKEKRIFYLKFFVIGTFTKLNINKQNKMRNSLAQNITHPTVGSAGGVKVNISCQKKDKPGFTVGNKKTTAHRRMRDA
jgi:hypothetical protein